MIYLLAAVAALAFGPLVLALAGERRGHLPFLDGFVVVAVPGLIFLHFVPEAVEETEVLPLLALAAGFVAPLLLERLTRDQMGRADRWALVLGLTGLCVHAALDGAVLPSLHGSEGLSLGLAVVVHRVPVGVAVWWLVLSHFGRPQAVLTLLVLVSVTVVGYLGGTELAGAVGGTGVHLYQAAVGGSLVHVVFHRIHPSGHGPQTFSSRRIEGFGAVTALIILGVLAAASAGPAPTDHAHDHGAGGGFLQRLFVLSAMSAPALLLAYLFSGFLNAFLPTASIRWMAKGGGLTQSGKGMLFGLPLPVCSCGVVPLYQTLIMKGAPPAAAMAFLVATPELGLDAILLSVPLLGPQMTGLRVLAAGAAALLTGWWVGSRFKARATVNILDEEDLRPRSPVGRLGAGLRTGFGEVVDKTAPWIVVGLAVAALAAPVFEGGWLGRLPPLADVVLFAALGFPTYVCASSATPLVATFLATGLSPGAAIAFLITGPATNISTLGVVGGAHGRRAALLFATTLVGIAVGTGIALNLLLGAVPVPSLSSLTEELPGALRSLALGVLVLLYLSSVLRQGIRRFAGELKGGLGRGSPLSEESLGSTA